jgi:hypothetical protein
MSGMNRSEVRAGALEIAWRPFVLRMSDETTSPGTHEQKASYSCHEAATQTQAPGAAKPCCRARGGGNA